MSGKTLLALCEVCQADPCICEISEADYEYGDPECCGNCGKPFDEFGDLGCERCDRRHPNFGVLQ